MRSWKRQRASSSAYRSVATVRIIGVDPGTLITGYGVIDAAEGRLVYVTGGCIRNRSATPLPGRFLIIYRELRKIFELHKPDQMAVEGLFFCKNVRSALALGEARGVAMLVAAESGVEVFEYAPRRVKQAVIGSGGAQKRQVQFMIKSILDMDGELRPTDAADALAIAICHALQIGIRCACNPALRGAGSKA
ncbi:MAG: crossover junction endodeoxyribonuclease RuvC [Candidatus Aureabacteria bacterium]|nr:crossover junction endodeoxyribonuclease RuvC [Candidatus Auribacterota bacterium]